MYVSIFKPSVIKTIAFGHSILAMSGEETLAQVYREVESPKLLNFKKAALIVDEPTRGVDVGAKAEIHKLLDELACAGLALLVISSELPEVMNLSRSILVMRAGHVAGVLPRAEATQPALMRLMAGVDAAA